MDYHNYRLKTPFLDYICSTLNAKTNVKRKMKNIHIFEKGHLHPRSPSPFVYHVDKPNYTFTALLLLTSDVPGWCWIFGIRWGRDSGLIIEEITDNNSHDMNLLFHLSHVLCSCCLPGSNIVHLRQNRRTSAVLS